MNDLKELAEKVLAWWEKHEYDTISSSDGDEWNVYDYEPDFVIAAREALKKVNGVE